MGIAYRYINLATQKEDGSRALYYWQVLLKSFVQKHDYLSHGIFKGIA